jgi:hypothetical protein
VAVAVNVATTDGLFVSDAVTVCEAADVGSVHVFETCPFAVLVAVGAPSVPAVAVNVTAAPATGLLLRSVTDATSGAVRRVFTAPVCASPDTRINFDATCCTLTVTADDMMPLLVRATTCAVPLATAVAVAEEPLPATETTETASLCHEMASETALPLLDVTVAVNDCVACSASSVTVEDGLT